jgi:hypothetical protein
VQIGTSKKRSRRICKLKLTALPERVHRIAQGNVQLGWCEFAGVGHLSPSRYLLSNVYPSAVKVEVLFVVKQP